MGEMLKREGLVVAEKAAQDGALHATAGACRRAEPGVVRGFQGLVSHRGRGADRSLDHRDAHSRYLLRCQAVAKTDTARVQAIFEAAFREYGLPQAIRTDNGPPFASTAIAGLSRLAVWWMKLGIVAERIEADSRSRTGGTSACIAP